MRQETRDQRPGTNYKKNRCFFRSLVSGLWSLVFFLFLVSGLWSLLCSPALAQDASIAEAFARLDRFESRLQAVEGNTEAQNVLIKQSEEKSDRSYRDLEMRLQAMEAKVNLFQTALDRSLAKVSPQMAGEFKKFNEALNLVQATQYAQALAAFQAFLKQYPKSAYKAESLFWIAECRTALKDYSQAIKDYQKFIEVAPKSDKVPTALLKQGDGFLALQMNEEAKVFLKKLIHDFPNSDEAAQAKIKLAALEKGVTTPPPATPLPPTSDQKPPVIVPEKEATEPNSEF